MEVVDVHEAIKQAKEAVFAINPKADIVRIWMGDTWPGCEKRRLMTTFDYPLQWIPMEPNPDADSLIEFSDGHFIVARTYEQGTGNPSPRFGKARRDSGGKGSGNGKGRKGC